MIEFLYEYREIAKGIFFILAFAALVWYIDSNDDFDNMA